MRKRIFSAVIIMILFLTMIAGCGLEGGDSSMGQLELHAKELDCSKRINIDYAKPSMLPVQQFGYDLLAYNIEEENPILSPVSAYIVLCMLGNGADGETKSQLEDVLGTDMKCIPDNLMNVLPQEKETMKLSIANSAWLDEAFLVDEEWLATVKSLFDSSVYQTDLNTETAKNDINKWVSDSTNEMIPNLLEQPFKNTKLALVDALYFKADWVNKFAPQLTMEKDFKLEDGTTEEVHRMAGICYDCGYLKDDRSEGVVLPYSGSNFAFVAIKPTGEEKIRDWYATYSSEKLINLIDSRKQTDVDVYMPKFTANCKMRLKDSLKEMGITHAFDENQADFTLLGKSEDEQNLYLDMVLQEAVVKVAEDGTEAAAATAASMSDGGASIEMVNIVKFDSPFLYMIMDMESGVPVFMGIMDNPKK